MSEATTRRFRLNSKQIGYGFLAILLVATVINNVKDQLSAPIAIKYSDADIAFASMRCVESGCYPVYLVNTANGNERPVLGINSGYVTGPTWAPDGQTLALEGVLTMGLSKFDPRYGRSGTYYVDATGKTSPFKPCSYSPAWSPDGEYLAYHYDCSNRDTRTEKTASLSIARLDGSDARDIVTGIDWHLQDSGRYQPIRISWSQDGEFLAYDNPDASIWYIWIVTLILRE